MSKKLAQLHEAIAEQLEIVRLLFKGEAKITIIVRNPDVEDGDVILSDDDFESAIAAIRHLQAKPTHVFPPTGKFADLEAAPRNQGREPHSGYPHLVGKLVCSKCESMVFQRGEFGLWYHSNHSLMCEDGEAVTYKLAAQQPSTPSPRPACPKCGSEKIYMRHIEPHIGYAAVQCPACLPNGTFTLKTPADFAQFFTTFPAATDEEKP